MKALYPLSAVSLDILKGSREVVVSFTIMGKKFESLASVSEVKESGKSGRGIIKVNFKDISKETRKKLHEYIAREKVTRRERSFKEIIDHQLDSHAIVNPKTLRDKMGKEVLEYLKYNKEGNNYFVQVDEKVKGKEAFVKYSLKPRSKDVYIKQQELGTNNSISVDH